MPCVSRFGGSSEDKDMIDSNGTSEVKQQDLLNIEQVAAICGVSPERVMRWVEKKKLRAGLGADGLRIVRRNDLIDFLLQYNMPIPASVVPYKAKKILFVLSHEVFDDIYMQFVFNFFERFEKNSNMIVDYVSYQSSAKMKMIVFKPDVVLIDVIGNGLDAMHFADHLRKNDECCPVKVVAIISSGIVDSVTDQLRSKGVAAFVPRNIELSSLINTIKKMC